MAKSFHELSPRAQLIVFALLAALTAGGSWQMLISGEMDEVANRRAKLSTLEGEVARARATAARLPAAQREVAALEASLRETTSVIPEEKDPQDVLRSLYEAASESLLDIASFKPKAVVSKTQYTEWPIELGFEGSYHDLGRFFDKLASMPRLISVADLKISTKTKPTGRGSVTASCIATTFVFAKEAAPAATGGQQ